MDEKDTPTSAELLAPDEASDKLERVLKDYFAWEMPDPKTGKALKWVLVKSPPGLGKTQTAFKQAIAYQVEQGEGQPYTFAQLAKHKFGDVGPTGVAQAVIFTHRHDLAREAKKLIEDRWKEQGVPVTVPILRGRTHKTEENDQPCKRWEEADALQKNGYPVFTNLCRRVSGESVSECPYFGECEYIKAYQDAFDAPFVIMVHAHLGLRWKPQSEVLAEYEEPEDQESPLFHPAYATTVICDEDPTQHLVEKNSLSQSKLEGIKLGHLGDHLLAGLRSRQGLLTYLRENEFTAQRLKGIADRVSTVEQYGQRIANPVEVGAVLGKQLASNQKRIALAPIVERLADELDSGREGVSYSLLPNRDGKITAQGRRSYPFTSARLLVLDGTANIDILKQFIPDLEMPPEIRVQRNAYVVQVSNRTFYKGSLFTREEGSGKPVPTNRLDEVGEFIEMIADAGKTLVVTNKPVRCALTGENGSNRLPISASCRGADIAHFGNIRGVNDFEDHENVIILGREELPVEAAERQAMAIWYDTNEPIERVKPDANDQRNYPKVGRSYKHSQGSSLSNTVHVSVHPDWRVQAVLEQRREAENLQAIDRLRLIHNDETKYVWILCNIPLDLPVDCLVTWGQLRATSINIRNIFRFCDKNGINAVSLAARELYRNYPDLWATENAAGRWLEKKPLDACKGIIRKWGVLVEYRPQGQRSWSKAIVRHGVEDQEAAIETALGLPSGSMGKRPTYRRTGIGANV